MQDGPLVEVLQNNPHVQRFFYTAPPLIPLLRVPCPALHSWLAQRCVCSKSSSSLCCAPSSCLDRFSSSSGIRLLIFSITEVTDCRLLYHQHIHTRLPIKLPTTIEVKTTKIMESVVIGVVKRAMRNEIPIVHKEIPTVKRTLKGVPCLRISSSCSVTSYSDNESYLPRRTLTGFSPFSAWYIRDMLEMPFQPLVMAEYVEPCRFSSGSYDKKTAAFG